MFGYGVCCQCGKLGHIVRQCPMSVTESHGSQASNYQPRQSTHARIYLLISGNVEANENATDVVTSTIPLFGSVDCILFDSGATHSFISFAFFKLCNLSTEPLEQKVCIEVRRHSGIMPLFGCFHRSYRIDSGSRD